MTIKDGNVKKTEDKDVILVVKGAGLHKPGDTLNQFLKGFIPAIKSVDPKAKIQQICDENILKDLPISPHTEKPDKQVTEIVLEVPNNNAQPEKRKIWVREVYWENELDPPSSWKAFSIEWEMASYALRRELTNFFRVLWLGNKQEPILIPPWKERISIFASFLVIYAIFLILFFNSMSKIYNLLYNNGENSTYTFSFITLLLFIASLLFIATSASLTYWRWKPQRQKFGELPGIPHWVMWLSIFSVLLSTQFYLLSIFLLAIPILLTNLYRGLRWKYRPELNSDRKTKEIIFDEKLEKKCAMKVPTEFAFTLLSTCYRLLILLSLPIGLLIALIAELLIFVKLFSKIGEGIKLLLYNLIGGILGDVGAYAKDPAQAYKIRGAIENEIVFFSTRAKYLHIFAHSQGTPITFETIFHELNASSQKKIKTYVTIGSILSYYYQTAPILERDYPPLRFRPKTYPQFPKEFKWVNCWNLLDPITQFYGLDEYSINNKLKPINIKTRARFHFDYWENLDEVQIPFVKRILDINYSWGPQKPIKGIAYSNQLLMTSILSSIASIFLFIALFIVTFCASYEGNFTNYKEEEILFKVITDINLLIPNIAYIVNKIINIDLLKSYIYPIDKDLNFHKSIYFTSFLVIILILYIVNKAKLLKDILQELYYNSDTN